MLMLRANIMYYYYQQCDEEPESATSFVVVTQNASLGPSINSDNEGSMYGESFNMTMDGATSDTTSVNKAHIPLRPYLGVLQPGVQDFGLNLDPVSRKEKVATPYFNSGCHGSSDSTVAYFVEATGVFSLEPDYGVGSMVLDFENYVVRLSSAEKDLGSTAVLNDASWLRSSVARERLHDDRYDCLFWQSESVETQDCRLPAHGMVIVHAD
ncbi:hypothetical protein Tco_0811904 [Tanacetum coccineum]